MGGGGVWGGGGGRGGWWGGGGGGWGGGGGVKWLDPDIVACLDGLDTKLYGDREQWV